MTASPAHSAIALLIDLAERGEIDPWDVQVIDAIDRCLSELRLASEDTRESYEAELFHSGQAFLYASMLVLLKADTLVRLEFPDPEELAEDVFLEMDDLARLPIQLERQLQRRAVAEPPQQRRVTLNELIDQLKLMAVHLEQREASSARSVRTHQVTRQSRAQAVRAIAQLAHNENLSELAEQLEQFLAYYWSQISQNGDWLELERLLELWSRANPPTDSEADSAENDAEESSTDDAQGRDRIGIFWALLLLSSQSKVELIQEEFYQDLKIRTLGESDGGPNSSTIVDVNLPPP